jgi:hypothetical protein
LIEGRQPFSSGQFNSQKYEVRTDGGAPGKSGGGAGFANVWYRERFAWEYKRQRENLEKVGQDRG